MKVLGKTLKLTPTLFLVAAFFAFWAAYFFYFWSNALYFDERGNLQVTHVSIWGDWAAHFTMGSAMAYRDLLPNQSPFLITAPFSYPFVANLISALLIRQGVDFYMAFVLPSAFASIILITCIFLFYKTLFKSQVIAVVASTIFLCNGGLGFIQFFADVKNSAEPLTTLLNPPLEYTHLADWNIEWISVIYSMIIPQRAFTLGFPISLLILILLYKVFYVSELKAKNNWYLISVAGILTGFLPLIHSHSFLALAIIIPFWGLSTLVNKKSKKLKLTFLLWLSWFAITAVIALPLVHIFLSKNISEGFFQWYPGWFAKEKNLNWFTFWLMNWGITPFLAAFGFIIFIKQKQKILLHRVLLVLPFFVIWLLLNLFLFQPFIWDNTKLLSWASVGVSGLAAYALASLGKYLYTKKFSYLIFKRVIGSFLLLLLFFLVIASGAIDAYRVLRFNLHTYQMYSQEELELAEWARTHTSANSIWLTGDQHNNWLFNLTGRQSLLTYRGWLWTHGYDYSEVETDVSTLYMQPTEHLVEKYGIDYAIIGYNELDVWQANFAAFDAQFPIIKQTPHYIIFDLSNRVN